MKYTEGIQMWKHGQYYTTRQGISDNNRRNFPLIWEYLFTAEVRCNDIGQRPGTIEMDLWNSRWPPQGRICISDYMHTFMLDIISHPYRNSNGCLAKPPLKLWHGWIIVSHLRRSMQLLINNIISNHINMRGQSSLNFNKLQNCCHNVVE